MNPLRQRRERRVLHEWDRRRRLVDDERSRGAHRLTCLTDDLTDPDRLCRLAEIVTPVLSSNIRTLVLDLRRVRTADTKLVGFLLQLTRRARPRGIDLRILSSDAVDHWLTFCRVDTVLGIHCAVPAEALAPQPRRLAS